MQEGQMTVGPVSKNPLGGQAYRAGNASVRDADALWSGRGEETPREGTNAKCGALE